MTYDDLTPDQQQRARRLAAALYLPPKVLRYGTGDVPGLVYAWTPGRPDVRWIVTAREDRTNTPTATGRLNRPERVTIAAERVRLAIYDEGRVPTHHRKVMARHRDEWPTLWRAIDALLRELEAPNP